MTDLRERFGQYREVEVPDLWDRIEELAGSASLEPTSTPIPVRLGSASFPTSRSGKSGQLRRWR